MEKKQKTILAIGGTGLGKSLFGEIVFGCNTKRKRGTERGTTTVEFQKNNKFIYVDTPGFNDTNGATDEDTFLKIMRGLEENSIRGVYEVNSILWFCGQEERECGSLQHQAQFIQRFFDYNHNKHSTGNPWESVLIVFKGNITKEACILGPQEAARKVQ